MNRLPLAQATSDNSTLHQQWQRIFVWPLLILCMVFLLVYSSGFDWFFASKLYQLQGEQWLLKDHWLTETVLHQSVRQLNLAVILLLLCYWLTQTLRGKHSATLRATGVLLLSLLLSVISIALIKRLLPMECPWDLQGLGGTQAFIGLLSERPAAMMPTQCFPAGHASIGYSWLGIYFFLRLERPELAATGLRCCIALGLLLGFAQQLRGAHFLSHDLATASICWTIAGLCFRYFYRAELLFSRYLPASNSISPIGFPLHRAAAAASKILSSKESSDV